MAANAMDLEQAGELKFGQVGIANLRIRKWDVAMLANEMRERVQRAPKLFDRAAVVLDFGGLTRCPEVSAARELISALREAGAIPVALAYGTSEIEQLSRELGLPLLAKFRASYERDSADPAPVAAAPVAKRKEPEPADLSVNALPATSTPVVSEVGMMQTSPVRSGQQIYAQNRDLTVCGMVSTGAEVIADGSIHIYGALRGRALAGANGNPKARIFCREFKAELVAVAGTYKVLEEIPKNLIGKAVQIWLKDETLHIEELA
jgi:septum site-determining protein MinC